MARNGRIQSLQLQQDPKEGRTSDILNRIGKGCKTDQDDRGHFTGVSNVKDSHCIFMASSLGLLTPRFPFQGSFPSTMQASCKQQTVGVCHPPRLWGRLPPASYKRQPGSEAWAVAVGTKSGTGRSWTGEAAESKGLRPGHRLLLL